MPVIAVVKAAHIAAKVAVQVEKKHPGLWWKVTAFVSVILLLGGMIAFQAVSATISAFLQGGYQEVCSVEVIDGNDGDSPHENGGGGSGSFSTSKTPWPADDSKAVVYPVPSPVLTSPWGYRPPFMVNGVMTPGYHNGLDFGQGLGTPVLSMADGTVAAAYGGNSLYGSHVAIKHRINGENYTSLYGHIQGPSIKVKVGDHVKAGQQIASVGMEGMSTAAHLHFVLTKGDYSAEASEPGYTGAEGNTIDPASFLSSKGAGKASGGLNGDAFDGVDGPEDQLCDEGESDFEGDGFTAWGGYENGEIPSDQLKAIRFMPEKKLFSRAATDLEALNADYRERFGKNLPLSKAYEASAVVGTSPFGWARAIQLNISFGSEEYKWMTSNAKKHGWTQPAAYREDGNAANAGIWGWKGSNSVPPAANESAEASRAIAKELLTDQYRWTEADYVCLVKLWERESNWNPRADNPTSDAYGIPQALPGSKMASEGADWKTNPETQIKWGLKYIKERYGSPCNAWGHSEDVGWY